MAGKFSSDGVYLGSKTDIIVRWLSDKLKRWKFTNAGFINS